VCLVSSTHWFQLSLIERKINLHNGPGNVKVWPPSKNISNIIHNHRLFKSLNFIYKHHLKLQRFEFSASLTFKRTCFICLDFVFMFLSKKEYNMYRRKLLLMAHRRQALSCRQHCTYFYGEQRSETCIVVLSS